MKKKNLNATTKNCFICLEEFLDDRGAVHRDHAISRIFGLAHDQCCLRQRTQSFIPAFFHNLSKYDSHDLIRKVVLESIEKKQWYLAVMKTTSLSVYISQKVATRKQRFINHKIR